MTGSASGCLPQDRPSEIASRVQAASLIRYTRGIIPVATAPDLERTTWDCYRIVKVAFDCLTGD